VSEKGLLLKKSLRKRSKSAPQSGPVLNGVMRGNPPPFCGEPGNEPVPFCGEPISIPSDEPGILEVSETGDITGRFTSDFARFIRGNVEVFGNELSRSIDLLASLDGLPSVMVPGPWMSDLSRFIRGKVPSLENAISRSGVDPMTWSRLCETGPVKSRLLG